MFRTHRFVGPVLLLILAVFACTLLAAPAAHATRVRFGLIPVLDTLPLRVAAEEGLFAARGLSVDLVSFNSAIERDAAMGAGQLDGYHSDTVSSLLLVQGGVDLRMVSASWIASPGQPFFGLVAGPQSRELTPDTLAGASVGISRNTAIEYVLDRMQERQRLDPGVMERIEVKKIPVRTQMLLSGQLDTAVLPEPLLSLVRLRDGKILLTDEDLGLPLTVLCLRDGFMQDHPTVRADFLAAVGEAVEHINQNPEAYRALMNRTCRIPAPLHDIIPVYTYPAPAPPTREGVTDTMAWMVGRGLLARMYGYAEVVAE